MRRCGGCRRELEVIVGGEVTAWVCPSVECSYDGPTMAERIERAVRELDREGHLTRLLLGPFARELVEDGGLEEKICDRCGTFYMTIEDGSLCMGCTDPEIRRARAILTLDEMATKMAESGGNGG